MNWRFVAPILAIVVCGCAPKIEQPAPKKIEVRENDPCRWLSARDAGEALGQRVLRTASAAPTYCRYAAPNVRDAATALAIQFSVDDDVNSYEKMIQREDAAAIAGLGDRAVWNTNGNSVVAIKGNRRLVLSVIDGKSPSTLSESDIQQRAVAAAQKIVEKM